MPTGFYFGLVVSYAASDFTRAFISCTVGVQQVSSSFLLFAMTTGNRDDCSVFNDSKKTLKNVTSKPLCYIYFVSPRRLRILPFSLFLKEYM